MRAPRYLKRVASVDVGGREERRVTCIHLVLWPGSDTSYSTHIFLAMPKFKGVQSSLPYAWRREDLIKG